MIYFILFFFLGFGSPNNIEATQQSDVDVLALSIQLLEGTRDGIN